MIGYNTYKRSMITLMKNQLEEIVSTNWIEKPSILNLKLPICLLSGPLIMPRRSDLILLTLSINLYKTKTYITNKDIFLIQGGFFNWTPPKFSMYKIPCKLAQNFSKCQRL